MSYAHSGAAVQLPAPVQGYLATAFDGPPPILTSLVLEGRGRVHIGPLPWLPIHARMHYRLGRDYVGLIRIRVAGLTLLRVIDAFVDKGGITKIGPVASIGPEIDQGAFLGMWPLLAAYPSAWTDGVVWEPIDEHRAGLRLPFGDGQEVATVDFDPNSGYPVRFAADRFKGASGRKVRWIGGSTDWRRIDGVPVPGRITAHWSDEPGPWFELEVGGAQTDVSIDVALAQGRRAIMAARRKKETAS